MKRRPFHWLFVLPLLAACGGPAPVTMVPTPTAPAAQGTVVARAGGNGNTKLSVEVKHLAKPEAVWPTAKVYVVWVRPQGGPPQNVGTLQIDDQLTGRLETSTPFRSFAVTITPEEFPAATSPRGPSVLEAAVSE